MSRNRPEIPVRANLMLALLLTAIGVYQLVILPVFLLPQSLHWAWTLIPVVLATNTQWALIHEAIHGVFHGAPEKNEAAGRWLSIIHGSPFRILRLGHLMHHRFNRSDLDRTEVLAENGSGRPDAVFVYYFRILGGLYLVEFVASLAALLPRRTISFLVFAAFGAESPDGRSMRRAAEQQLLEAPGYRQMRWDGAIIVVVFGLAFWLYGAAWWMLALALLGRAFLISFFDNSYHYGTTLDDVMASYNLKLPRVVSRLMLHFNLHAVHHRHPAVPWNGLMAAFETDRDVYEGGYVRVAFRQLRGPIAATALYANGAIRETVAPDRRALDAR